MPEPDLRLEGLVKSFGETRAVDGISLRLQPGAFYSLLGPSGCGKTTTLRLVAGFERPDEGRVVLQGHDVTAAPPHRRNVNTVFQHYALFPHLTVAQNVGFGLRQLRLGRDEAGRRLADALATVRLTELADRYPRELSGGQGQRVALARALINEPAVLLLDEPLAALDLKLRRAMQGELQRLQERVGVTFLYVTHDQEEALTLSDRIAVMHGGRIEQEGTPEEVYERPRTRFVAEFIGETNFFDGEVEVAGAETIVRADDGLQLRCAAAPWAAQGTRVTVAVRPERVEPANGASANTVDGTIARRTYLGDLVVYHVRLAGGREVACQRQAAGGGTPGWEVGAAVELSWPVESALVLAGGDEDREEDLRRTAEGAGAGASERGGGT